MSREVLEIVEKMDKKIIQILLYIHSAGQNARRPFYCFVKRNCLTYLNQKNVREALRLFGYQTLRLIDIFENLCARYQKYMTDHQSFPHELGLLLGYPVTDVLGFIKNKGKNYRYSGYWKVYGDVREERMKRHWRPVGTLERRWYNKN